MKKRTVFILLLAALLTACSGTDLREPVSGVDGEIMLRSSVIEANFSSTRNVYEDADLSAKPLTALVLTSLNEGDYADPRCVGTMTFNGSDAVMYDKPVAAGNYTFEKEGGDNIAHYLTGLYPAAGWTGAATRLLTLTGKEDVMLAPEVSTNYSKVEKSDFATLAFTHQLTLLKLKFLREEKSGFNIRLNTVSVKSLPTTVSVELSTLKVDFSGSGDLSAYLYNTDTPLPGGYDVPVSAVAPYAYVLVPPVTADAAAGKYEYVLHITYTDELNNNTFQDVSIDLVTDTTGTISLSGNSAGKANVITLNFKDGSIRGAATVTAWDDEGAKEIDI
jgi:hypothetical protein